MILGYDKALYQLPFDHRQSYVTDIIEGGRLARAACADQLAIATARPASE